MSRRRCCTNTLTNVCNFCVHGGYFVAPRHLLVTFNSISGYDLCRECESMNGQTYGLVFTTASPTGCTWTGYICRDELTEQLCNTHELITGRVYLNASLKYRMEINFGGSYWIHDFNDLAAGVQPDCIEWEALELTYDSTRPPTYGGAKCTACAGGSVSVSAARFTPPAFGSECATPSCFCCLFNELDQDPTPEYILRFTGVTANAGTGTAGTGTNDKYCMDNPVLEQCIDFNTDFSMPCMSGGIPPPSMPSYDYACYADLDTGGLCNAGHLYLIVYRASGAYKVRVTYGRSLTGGEVQCTNYPTWPIWESNIARPTFDSLEGLVLPLTSGGICPECDFSGSTVEILRA